MPNWTELTQGVIDKKGSSSASKAKSTASSGSTTDWNSLTSTVLKKEQSKKSYEVPNLYAPSPDRPSAPYNPAQILGIEPTPSEAAPAAAVTPTAPIQSEPETPAAQQPSFWDRLTGALQYFDGGSGTFTAAPVQAQNAAARQAAAASKSTAPTETFATSAEKRAVEDKYAYAGWATDELSAQNMYGTDSAGAAANRKAETAAAQQAYYDRRQREAQQSRGTPILSVEQYDEQIADLRRQIINAEIAAQNNTTETNMILAGMGAVSLGTDKPAEVAALENQLYMLEAERRDIYGIGMDSDTKASATADSVYHTVKAWVADIAQGGLQGVKTVTDFFLRTTADPNNRFADSWEELNGGAKQWVDNASGYLDSVESAAQEAQSKAINSASTAAGRMGQEMLVTGIQMGLDAVSGMPQAAMFLRVMGMSSHEARQYAAENGIELSQTRIGAYSLYNAAVETLTEKMFDGLAGIYGAGAADDMIKSIARGMTSSQMGQNTIKYLMSASGEGVEEVVADLAEPFGKWILTGQVNPADLVNYDFEQMGHDFILGSAMGLIGGGMEYVSEMAQSNNQPTAPTVADNPAAPVQAEQTAQTAPQTAPAQQAQPTEIDNLVNAATGNAINPQQNLDNIDNAQIVQAPVAAQESAQELTQQQTQDNAAEERTEPVAQFNESTEAQQNVQAQAESGNEGTEHATAAAIARRGGTEETHITNRTMNSVGDRKVNAFQFDNPQIKPFFQQAAQILQNDLALSTSYIHQYQHRVFSNKLIDRIMRQMSRNDAMDALQKIIDDSGLENNANAKRLEIILDDMLSHGYKPLDTDAAEMPVNNAYIQAREAIKGGKGDSDTYRIQQAVEAEMDAALFEGEALTEEEALARVMQYYEEHGYYSMLDEIEQRKAEAQGSEEQTAEYDEDAENEEYAEEYDYNEGENAADDLVLYETVNSDAENAPTVEQILENAKANEAPKAQYEPNADENGNYAITAKPSQTVDHTLKTIAENLGGEQDSIYYVPISERQTLTEAVNRVNADMTGELAKLAEKEMWTAADIDTAMTIYGYLKADSVSTGNSDVVNTWAKIVQERGTRSGQALQAFQKWTRTGAAQAAKASETIAEADNLTQEQKEKLQSDISDFAAQFDSIEDNKIADVRDLIKRMNKYRGTGTFVENNFGKILDSETDFDYLKEYAFRQMLAIVDDATTRASLPQQLKAWQIKAQLSRLTSFNRNMGGNAAFGVQDTIAQDSFGIAIDSLISKFTGQRTVKLEKAWLDSEARKAAVKELNRAILEIAGDVNMQGNASRYGTSTQRTNKMSGGKMQRFLSRWEQGLGYSLTASDRFFRGQIEQSIKNSLADSGLSEEQISEIAKQVADYRLFQNNGKAASASRALNKLANDLVGFKDANGNSFGLGDIINPYPGVPANLGVKALEYSPLNIVKGIKQTVDVIQDAKAGKYDAAKQNEAVMNIARGASGVPLIAALVALFASGLIKNYDDEEDLDIKAQNAAEGKSGVQINLSALSRAFNHGSAEWRDGDDLMSIGWLEPMNAFLAIASLIATDEDQSISGYAGNYLEGTLQSVLDLPVMANVKSIFDTYQYSTADSTAGKMLDVALDLAGNSVTGMMPAPLSQTAKTVDPYFRDTSSDSEIGYIVNNIISNIPILRQTLPEKLDNYGNPKRYADSVLQRLLNNFLLPGAVNDLHQTEVSAAIEELYNATGNAKVYPDRNSPKSFSHNKTKYELTNAERQAYHETYGQVFETEAARLISSYNWQYLWTDEQKVDAITKIEKQAEDAAKQELVQSRGEKW